MPDDPPPPLDYANPRRPPVPVATRVDDALRDVRFGCGCLLLLVIVIGPLVLAAGALWIAIHGGPTPRR